MTPYPGPPCCAKRYPLKVAKTHARYEKAEATIARTGRTSFHSGARIAEAVEEARGKREWVLKLLGTPVGVSGWDGRIPKALDVVVVGKGGGRRCC